MNPAQIKQTIQKHRWKDAEKELQQITLMQLKNIAVILATMIQVQIGCPDCGKFWMEDE